MSRMFVYSIFISFMIAMAFHFLGIFEIEKESGQKQKVQGYIPFLFETYDQTKEKIQKIQEMENARNLEIQSLMEEK
ncbi:MAG: hypothetical protein NTZ97_03025 [Candidatus Moranbacteria bacterium]|nr:hypothetical protein [Candidatus Moranbacteria bacterium]